MYVISLAIHKTFFFQVFHCYTWHSVSLLDFCCGMMGGWAMDMRRRKQLPITWIYYSYLNAYSMHIVCVCAYGSLNSSLHHYSCWLRYDTNFIWTFIAPVIFIIMVCLNYMINTHHNMIFLSLWISISFTVQHWFLYYGTDHYVSASKKAKARFAYIYSQVRCSHNHVGFSCTCVAMYIINLLLCLWQLITLILQLCLSL